ncbi:hypothetical protein VM1G_08627 [Cytospora mali]|uniref:Rhodopsin domain-containing protein n=1 Tax=Cytospora mali TaxID=578113 RepID=A0A194W989_CYTMA|nr:hypothetical protein VM1G_08627 [Valsa mali]
MAAIASEYLADMLEPQQFAAAIFGVTLTFTVLSINAIGLRTWARRQHYGHDDFLMYTALVVNLVHNAIIMCGTFVGIGSPDSRLSTDLYLFLWQVFYATDLVFIKTSILTALKRVGKERRFIYIIWGLIVLVSLLSVAAVITLLAKCQPIQANWTGDGTCVSSNVFAALAKTAYVFDVLSDLAMAILSTLQLPLQHWEDRPLDRCGMRRRHHRRLLAHPGVVLSESQNGEEMGGVGIAVWTERA